MEIIGVIIGLFILSACFPPLFFIVVMIGIIGLILNIFIGDE